MARSKNSKIFWYQALTEGMDQASDTALTGGSECIKNAVLDQPGNICVRKGSDLIETKMGTNPGYGLWSHTSTRSATKLYAVTDQDLFYWKETATAAWTKIDTDEWTASKRVDGIDFRNYSYIGCNDNSTALAYTSGTSAITDVTPTITGSVLAVNKNILAVGSTADERIFFTDAYSDRFYIPLGAAKAATATCRANADEDGSGYAAVTTDILPAGIEGSVIYNTTDGAMGNILDWVHGDNTTSGNAAVYTDADTSGWNGDTVYILSNVARLDNPCTGSIGYQGKFISFDENMMYIWDPTTKTSDRVPGFGCINYRTLKIVNGLLIGVSRYGIWMKSGESRPQYITAKIQNSVNGYGIWDLIDRSNWDTICAGAQESKGKYWLSLGTLSTLSGAPLSAASKVIVVLDVRTGEWTWRAYQDQINCFASYVNSDGEEGLYGIGNADAGVWLFDTGTTDDNAAGEAQTISFDIRTPHVVTFGHPYQSRADRYFVKYTAAAAVTVQESVNRGTYATIGTLPIASSIVIQDVKAGANKEGYSHSLKFTGTGAFTLEAWGVLAYRLAPYTGIPIV